MLFIYYSSKKEVADFCDKNVESNYTDVYQISPKYSYSAAKKLSCAAAGKGIRIQKNDIDFSKYDTVILATTLTGGMPAPAVNEFLHTTNLTGIEVIGVIMQGKVKSKQSAEILRKRIHLAGGECRSVVNIPVKEIKRNPEHAAEYIKCAVTKAEAR